MKIKHHKRGAARHVTPAKQMALTREAAFERVRAILGEHFEDFIFAVRVRCPDELWHVTSDTAWASGACQQVLHRLSGCDE